MASAVRASDVQFNLASKINKRQKTMKITTNTKSMEIQVFDPTAEQEEEESLAVSIP